MKSIITPKGTFGGFHNVTLKDDGYEADDSFYPFTVIGDVHEIGEWVEPVVEVKVEVPQTITRRQAIQQLIDDDLIDSVEAVLNAIPNPKQQRLMESWYKDSQVFERQRPEIVMVMSSLGKDSAFIDDLFIKASKR